MTSDSEDFKQQMLKQGVKPLAGAGISHFPSRRHVKLTVPDPDKHQHRLSAEGYMENHHIDAGGQITWLGPHDVLEYRQPGIQLRLFKSLKQGQLEVGSTMDLHGLRVEEARVALLQFVTECSKRGVRCGLLIHGKGWHADAADPEANTGKHSRARLKSHVNHWLQAIPEVLAFCSAIPRDGGTGAVYILFKKADLNTGA